MKDVCPQSDSSVHISHLSRTICESCVRSTVCLNQGRTSAADGRGMCTTPCCSGRPTRPARQDTPACRHPCHRHVTALISGQICPVVRLPQPPVCGPSTAPVSFVLARPKLGQRRPTRRRIPSGIGSTREGGTRWRIIWGHPGLPSRMLAWLPPCSLICPCESG